MRFGMAFGGCFKRGPGDGSERLKASQQRSKVEYIPKKVVMGRYVMHMTGSDVISEDFNSVLRRAFDLQTDAEVAIRTYKTDGLAPEDLYDSCCKFRRYIAILKELTAPLTPPSDATLWCETLARVDPKSLFIQLIDYSRDESGQPGPDPADGMMYAITEQVQGGLNDYTRGRRKSGKKIPPDTLRNFAQAVMLTTAGLHSRGFVHLDLRPESFMFSDGALKLADVESCRRTGTLGSSLDNIVVSSPVYCAPEWATFLALQSDEVVVTPALDVWSVGMLLSELVTCTTLLPSASLSIPFRQDSYQGVSYAHMQFLRNVQIPPLPKRMEKVDVELYQLLKDRFLVLDPSKRKSLAESLRHPYMSPASQFAFAVDLD